jgi:hypothetical protein
MPTYPTTVYDADGNPAVMHSVDAKEAVMLGDYTYAPPSDQPDPEKLAAARAKFQGGMGEVHPELLTEEERDKKREAANEKAALLANVPEGAQVVVMAPESAASRSTGAPRRATSASHAAPQSSHATPSSSESASRAPSRPSTPRE